MEIERKFLVSYLPENLDRFPRKEIEQSYISTNPTIRLRKSNDKYILTVKGEGSISREEFELPLSKEQYTNLMKKTETQPISKTRYLIPIDCGLTAELDVYHNNLSGLYTVEVEFDSIENANCFNPPDWFSTDISTDNRYKNTSLSLNGIPYTN